MGHPKVVLLAKQVCSGARDSSVAQCAHCVGPSAAAARLSCSRATWFGVYEKSATAPAKLRTFETPFNANGTGLDGYENPSRAHIANTINIAPVKNIEYRVIEIRLKSSRREKVDNSIAKSGVKKATR